MYTTTVAKGYTRDDATVLHPLSPPHYSFNYPDRPWSQGCQIVEVLLYNNKIKGHKLITS